MWQYRKLILSSLQGNFLNAVCTNPDLHGERVCITVHQPANGVTDYYQSNFYMPKINLRPARLADKIALQMLYRRTIDYACINDYDQQQRDAWKRGTENESRWVQAISEQFFVIAEIDSEIVGFGSLKNGCYIDFMYTDPGHSREGVGLAIYMQLEAKARDQGVQALKSDVSKTARPFFAKLGFRLIRENHNLIQGVQIVNYHMQKTLIAD